MKKNMHGHQGTHRHHDGTGGKSDGHKGRDNDVDGQDCVNYDVTDADFKVPPHYQEGPSGYTGGGANEKHS